MSMTHEEPEEEQEEHPGDRQYELAADRRAEQTEEAMHSVGDPPRFVVRSAIIP